MGDMVKLMRAAHTMEDRAACLDTEDVAAFISGSLKSIDVANVEHHLGECAQCRELLALVARSDSMSPSRSSTGSLTEDPTPQLASDGWDYHPGAQVGRYVL